jgi:cyclophilin family peptidyl-prolyl cis-trans isomerase
MDGYAVGCWRCFEVANDSLGSAFSPLMKRFGFLLAVLYFAISSTHGGTLAQFRTVLGDVEVELYDQDKPVTVQNFIRYARSGAYANTFFHRCIPNFVVQGGGFAVADPQSQAAFSLFGTLLVPTFDPITNEFNVGPHLSNVYGTIAMAKTSDPNSATSQFFFNLTNNVADLDDTNNSGGFTVFGRVLRGTNVLNFFNTLNKATFTGIVDYRLCDTNAAAGFFSDLPVRYSGPFCPRYVDLVYVDVSLLNVRVQSNPNGSREISWNSVSNLLNRVEFTTNLPLSWQTLASTNGTGGVLKIVDADPVNAQRFYRVRVDY